MAQRPKDIGTAFTTAVIRYLNPNGFPQAELRNQAGAYDKGDIVGMPGVCVECKGGKAAESAGDELVRQWVVETETECANSGADVGVLVMKRKAVGAANAGRWWAVLTVADVARLLAGGGVAAFAPQGHVRMHLADAVVLLRAAGYGTPLVVKESA